MKIKTYIPILIFFLATLSCKKKEVETDNVFQFREYISYTTSGIISVASPIQVSFTQDIPGWEQELELDTNILNITPHVQGTLVAGNKHALVFTPDEALDPDTEYTVTVKLDKIYKDIPKDFENFTFQFKTITPNFTIDMGSLQSYSKRWQYVNATVRSADLIPLSQARELVSASQKGKDLQVVFEEINDKSRIFNLKIDSIYREDDDDKILISWNGKPINADNTGENEFLIPGRNNFSIVHIAVEQTPEQSLTINFSDPLKKDQNFDGLVSIQGVSSPKFLVNGNVLKVYPNEKLSGNIQVEVFQGISNTDGFKLKKPYSETVSFEDLKPQIKLLSSGNILPNSNELKLNFEAVNLKAVDVRVIKIFEDNILQFLQDNDLNSNYQHAIRQVGRRIAKKTVTLIQDKAQNTGTWKAYSIDLSHYFRADPGAIYRVELSFDKSYSLYPCDESSISNTLDEDDYYDDYEDEYYLEDSEDYSEDQNLKEEAYWDNLAYRYRTYSYNWRERDNPCHDAYYSDDRIVSQNLIASNLGVIAKRGENNSYFFAVSDILSTEPIANAQVKLFNYQQQEIAQKSTDDHGFTMIDDDKHASFAIITKGKNKTYLKLDDGHSLSLSKFDVSGNDLQRGLKGYIYGERGVWRPGDSLHLAFILNDNTNKLPKSHPVKMEITDPNGKLVYRQVLTDHEHHFYKFTVPTATEYKTGNYSAKVSVGGAKFYKNLKIETVKPNRLKIKLDFGDQVLSKDRPLQGDLSVNWLHGAPGKNLKAEVKAKFSKSSKGFENYKTYVFQDPSKEFDTEEVTIFESQVNAEGNATISKSIDLGKNAPGLLNAQFLVRAFENGGDFSMDAFSNTYAPYDAFVGLKTPEGDRYGSFETGKNQVFDVVLLTPEGKPIARENLQVKVYKIEWRWWWNSSYDNLSSYVSNNYHRPVLDTQVSTGSQGKGSFSINIPEDDGGRYLIRVLDPESGHSTGTTAYFFKNWWETMPSSDKEAAKMLVFQADKEQYQVGETAKITFPSGKEGRALVSLENGTEVIHYRWVKTSAGQTTVDIPITKEMAPNVFVNISLLQPHAVTANDLPIRLYGVIPLMVEDTDTKLQPVIKMADELQPEQEFNISVSEKTNKAMTYTVAVVDEGLLDLTRFKTPNAWNEFYAREALGVKTWDMFDDVIGAYSGSIDQVFAIGGDGEASSAKNKKANRFKPVVMYLGPYHLEAGKKQTHTFKMPNYVGSVRAMVVAGDNTQESYGSTEKAVAVKKPLMVLASLPRKLSPTEKVTLPVTVFAMKPHVKQVNLTLKLSEGISVVGNKSQIVSFDKPDEKMAYFELEVNNSKGIHTVEVLASGNGESSSYKVELDVVNPNPISSKAINLTLNANGSKKLELNTFGVTGTNTATVEFSTVPPMDFSKRLQYLIQYPHGCVEQTTSSVFPQLFLSDIFDLKADKKQSIQKNIEKGITRLSHFQLPNGGLGYWMGNSSANDWGTSYAGHFMLEAEKKGYVLPIMFKSNWLSYQKQAARDWRPSYHNYHSDLAQAYRLYTLALAGQADLASMNRLREFSELSNEAKWRLAAAYALAGQKEASLAILKTAHINFKPVEYHYYTYGSVDRNRAMALETMVLIKSKDTRELVELIAKDLSSNKWMSTQTTSYSLLAMAKMVQANGGKALNIRYKLDGQDEIINTSKAVAQRTLKIKDGSNNVSFENIQGNVVYVTILNSGKLPLGQELVEQRGLSASVIYKDMEGHPISIRSLKQGQDFVAIVKVSNLKALDVHDVALTQIFPSGWEIVNTRFTEFGEATSSDASYVDIKDDRVSYYFDVSKQGSNSDTKTFNIMLNASYLGTYYLPGIQAEAMYDDDYLVRGKGQWITVEK